MSDTPFVNKISTFTGLRRLNVLWILALLASFGPLCTDMYLPALPHISSDLGLSISLTQASITTCLLGLALGQIFIRPISDGQGRKKLLVSSLVVFILTSVACAVVTNGYVFLGLRFIQGLAGSGGLVLSRAISCDTYSGIALTRFMSLLMAIHSVAPTLGPVLGGFIAGQAGWQIIFWVLAGIGIYLALNAAFAVPESLDPAKRVPGGVAASLINMGTLFRQKAFMAYTAQQGFTMAGFFAYVSASPFVFQNIYKFSMEEFSLVFGGISLSIMLMALTSGPLSARFGNRFALVIGETARLVAALCVLAVVLIEPASPAPLIVALIILVSLQGLTLTCSFALAIDSQVTGAGAASGLLGVACFLFGACVSPLTGLAGPASALPLGIIIAVTAAIAMCMTLLGNKFFMNSPARGLSLVNRLHQAREAKAKAHAKARERIARAIVKKAKADAKARAKQGR